MTLYGIIVVSLKWNQPFFGILEEISSQLLFRTLVDDCWVWSDKRVIILCTWAWRTSHRSLSKIISNSSTNFSKNSIPTNFVLRFQLVEVLKTLQIKIVIRITMCWSKCQINTPHIPLLWGNKWVFGNCWYNEFDQKF